MMTDKQIITEIDVNKCEFCESGEYCNIYSGTADFKWLCEENEDCQIKNLLLQLKRKEQECERLKHDNGYEVGALEKTIDNLKAEREEALKQLEFVRTLNTVQEAEIRKLSKTLTEIKEIAETCSFTDSSELLLNRFEKILQKISECEGNNE